MLNIRMTVSLSRDPLLRSDTTEARAARRRAYSGCSIAWRSLFSQGQISRKPAMMRLAHAVTTAVLLAGVAGAFLWVNALRQWGGSGRGSYLEQRVFEGCTKLERPLFCCDQDHTG